MQPSKFIVRDTDTLEQAIVAIDSNLHRTVIVVNEHDIVVGTLSDGDVRKSVLDHRLLSTPVHKVMNMNFIALTEPEKGKAKSIFNEQHIFLIPVIDQDGKLLEVLDAY
jgi:CBS domain-containing protein